MKSIASLTILLLLAACTTKPNKSDAPENAASDNLRIENYFEELFHKKVTATIYSVHPEICGACSNEFLVKMSKTDLGSKFYLLATGEFKKEHQDAADKIKHRIKFVESQKLGRIGISTQVPQKIILINGKVCKIDYLEL